MILKIDYFHLFNYNSENYQQQKDYFFVDLKVLILVMLDFPKPIIAFHVFAFLKEVLGMSCRFIHVKVICIHKCKDQYLLQLMNKLLLNDDRRACTEHSKQIA